MLFGEFLVKQKTISVEQYVKAKIIQANALPSLPQALYDLKLMTPDEMWKAFNHQTTHMKDFKEACIDLGYWRNEAFEHALLRYFLSAITPIGDVLVSENLVSKASMDKLRKDYVQLSEDAQPEE